MPVWRVDQLLLVHYFVPYRLPPLRNRRSLVGSGTYPTGRDRPSQRAGSNVRAAAWFPTPSPHLPVTASRCHPREWPEIAEYGSKPPGPPLRERKEC